MAETVSSDLRAPDLPRTAGNERTSFLKLAALVFMVIDHAAVIFFGNSHDMRLIGRLAFPLYVWCLVVGMSYTRNPLRYSLRLLAAAVVSQFFYVKALNHDLNEYNVLFTLLLGQLAILGIRQNRYGSAVWMPLICLAVTMFVKLDYSWKGVLFIILLYMTRNSKAALAAVMVAFCLFWGEGTFAINTLFGLDVKQLWTLAPNTADLFKVVFRVQNMAVLALPLILLPIGFRKRLPVWLGYIAYPGHLAVLWLLKNLLK